MAIKCLGQSGAPKRFGWGYLGPPGLCTQTRRRQSRVCLACSGNIKEDQVAPATDTDLLDQAWHGVSRISGPLSCPLMSGCRSAPGKRAEAQLHAVNVVDCKQSQCGAPDTPGITELALHIVE